MPRRFVGSRVFGNSSPSELSINEEFPNCVGVYYQPSSDKLKESTNYADPATRGDVKRRLLSINGQDDLLTIYPLNTISTHPDFLGPKYKQIESIVLEGFGYDIPASSEDVQSILEELPLGFVMDYEYGLGLLKDFRYIIVVIERLPMVKHLVISSTNDTQISNDRYTLSFGEYDSLRKAINRITSKQVNDGSQDKFILAHNSLLTRIDAETYLEKSRPYKKDTIFKLIPSDGRTAISLSESDQSAAVRLVSQNTRTIAQNTPRELLQLRDDIELVTLESLIQKFEEMLEKDLAESYWQKLFTDNPFILNLAFGFPIVKVNDQATVGGRTLAGVGDKVADFLVKNSLTHNTALVEIKTPKTKLLAGEYRATICGPSPDLGGAINQLLDQKYKFQKEIASLKDNSDIRDIESYSVNCVLVIGKLPAEKDHKKAFELFRNNSKEIEIVTFDELLERLRHLHAFLSLGRREDASAS